MSATIASLGRLHGRKRRLLASLTKTTFLVTGSEELLHVASVKFGLRAQREPISIRCVVKLTMGSCRLEL